MEQKKNDPHLNNKKHQALVEEKPFFQSEIELLKFLKRSKARHIDLNRLLQEYFCENKTISE